MSSSRPALDVTPSPWRRGRRRWMLAASAGFSLHQAFEALVPISVGIAIDLAISQPGPLPIAIAVGLLGVLFVALMYAWRMGELAAMRLYVDSSYEVRRRLVTRMLSPLSAYRGRPAHAMSTLGADVDEATSMVWTIGGAIASCVAVATAATGLLLISLPLGALVLIATPVLMLVMHFVTKPLERRSAAEQEALAESTAVTGDLLTGLRTVKGLDAEDEALRRFRAANARSLSTALRSASAEATYSGLSTLISGAFLVLLAAVAASFVLSGGISVGQLVSVVGLAQFLQWPVASLGYASAGLARARASARRVTSLTREPAASSTDAEPTGTAASRATAPDGTAISLAVTMRARGLVGETFANLDLDVAAGELVAIRTDPAVAAELSAMLGARMPIVAGTLLVAGQPPAAARPGEPPLVLSPPHHPDLLTGTVAEGVDPLGRGLSDATRARLARAAVLDDVLSDGGWERQVGERGRLLSGGQRQRVAIARALATDAALLVLHEPTTSLDAVTAALVAQGISTYRTGRTTVLLTHSPALLSVCDRVITIDDALVVAPAPAVVPA